MDLTYLWVAEAAATLVVVLVFFAISAYRMRGESWTESTDT